MADDHDEQDTNEQRGRIAVEKAIEGEPQWLIGRVHRCADLTQEEKRFLEGLLKGPKSLHYRRIKPGPRTTPKAAAKPQKAAYLARWLRRAEGDNSQKLFIDEIVAKAMGTTTAQAGNWRRAGEQSHAKAIKLTAFRASYEYHIEEEMRIFNEQRLAGFPNINPDEWRPDELRDLLK